MKRIAALLTVYNRKEGTLKCLQRLLTPTTPQGYTLDVFLTNDACTDGTPQAVQQHYPKVHIINGDGTLFWNRGMIAAWKQAAKDNYDHYLWLNDDTFVYPNLLPDLTQAAQHHPDAIIVGPTQSLDHSRMTYGGSYHNHPVTPNGKLMPLTCFNGNIVLVPRSAFHKLGYLDHYFRHSKGDFDYAMRAVKAGIPILLAPHYLGECDLHPSLDKWCNPHTPLTTRLRLLYHPNGMPPHEIFHLEHRHLGLLPAMYHYCTVHLRCLFPQIWTHRK